MYLIWHVNTLGSPAVWAGKWMMRRGTCGWLQQSWKSVLNADTHTIITNTIVVESICHFMTFTQVLSQVWKTFTFTKVTFSISYISLPSLLLPKYDCFTTLFKKITQTKKKVLFFTSQLGVNDLPVRVCCVTAEQGTVVLMREEDGQASLTTHTAFCLSLCPPSLA